MVLWEQYLIKRFLKILLQKLNQLNYAFLNITHVFLFTLVYSSLIVLGGVQWSLSVLDPTIKWEF